MAVAQPAGVSEGRHLTVEDWVAFLYEAIVPFPYGATRSIVHQYGPDRASTVPKASGRELECPCHVTLMNLAGHAVTPVIPATVATMLRPGALRDIEGEFYSPTRRTSTVEQASRRDL